MSSIDALIDESLREVRVCPCCGQPMWGKPGDSDTA